MRHTDESRCQRTHSVRLVRGAGFFAALGFGTTPEADAQAYRPGTGAAMFGSPIRLMAQGLGWSLDEIRDRKDVAVARSDFSCPAGDVPAGTIISVRIVAEGIVDGEPRLVISEAWTLDRRRRRRLGPAAVGRMSTRLTRITIDGTPSVSVDLSLDGTPLPGADATAARVVNAIDAVCAAGAGRARSAGSPDRPQAHGRSSVTAASALG